MDFYTLAIIFLVTGTIAGLLAGFLGIGGGLIVVPLLTFALPLANVPEHYVMTMAIGTSLATIIFTAISTLVAHQKRANIIWPAVFSIFPGVMLGSMLGAAVGSQMAGQSLMVVFGTFCVGLGLYTSVGERWFQPAWDYNQSRNWLSLVGFLIAIASAIVGIGGGTLLGPWLVWLGLEARKAVGTSAACGLFIAIFGAASYLITGSQLDDLPQYSLGHIYLPAFFGIIATSMLTAPLGARMASYFSAKTIKICLTIALFAAASKMFLSV
ncbi:sulfite exporter TauE/SafE family protein [Saccharobesus litoralis]|uniref:Probable membrane transporter protein n=1 Tax=Saccharobesus litoralis TaxID=2172099 RepID=A0A2S0VWK3_9ALTE|nr:sulfite exporter TauE/SafE family protein [Saccharobesus litoralis]AWB68552.1 sulfite exporter TauE/SafE family protein [Saccharobesus litoralis]